MTHFAGVLHMRVFGVKEVGASFSCVGWMNCRLAQQVHINK